MCVLDIISDMDLTSTSLGSKEAVPCKSLFFFFCECEYESVEHGNA